MGDKLLSLRPILHHEVGTLACISKAKQTWNDIYIILFMYKKRNNSKLEIEMMTSI